MADDPVEKVDQDEAELKAELEAEGEILDESGKPLPWNHPKRVRQIYKAAKEGRQATAVLKDLGLKPSEAARLKADLNRLAQFDEAYERWQEQHAKGEVDEDEEAAAAKKAADKFRRQLKSLGVKFNDDEEPRAAAKEAETRKTELVQRSHDTIVVELEDAGFDLDKMEPEDRKDLLDELDFKVGQKLARNEEARDAVLRGSMRPIIKFTREVLETLGKTKKPSEPKGTGIKNLPPRGGSSPGSTVKKVDQPEPKTTKEATEQMVADLRARRLAGKGE